MGQSLDASAAKLSRKGIYATLFKQAFGSDTITGERIVKALAQFERTLVSANSRYDQYLVGEYQPTELERQGIALFYTGPSPARNTRGAGCVHCHAGPSTFNELFHNNGLDSFPKDPGREQITGHYYLSKYLLVKCADGYEVLFSLAELDSSFTDRIIILSDTIDGGSLPVGKGPFRLVVPGEKKPARSSFQVTEMVIRFAKD